MAMAYGYRYQHAWLWFAEKTGALAERDGTDLEP